MPYQQVFELKDRGQIHGSEIVDQSINLSVKGMPGTLDANLFPETLDLRVMELNLNRLLLEAGTAGDPAFSFRVEPTSGLYRAGSGSLSLAILGVEAWKFGQNRLRGPDGSASVPTYAFLNDGDTGMYLRLDGNLAFSTVGVERVRIGNNALIVGGGADGNARIQTDGKYTFEADTDTYMHRPSSDLIDLVAGGARRLRIETALVTLTTPMLTPTGSAAAPALQIGQSDEGLYRPGAGQVGITTNGTQAAGFVGSNLRLQGSYTWLDDTNTRIYNLAADNIGFDTGGAERMRIGVNSIIVGGLTTGNIRMEFDGKYSFQSDTDTYMFRPSSDQIGFATGGSTRLVVGSTSMTYSGSTVLHTGNHSGSGDGHVTNGNSHNHSGGDGGAINHGSLDGLGDIDDHTWAIIDGGSTTASANTWFGGARSIKVVSSQLKNKTSISTLLKSDEHPHTVPAEKRAERHYPFSVLDLTPIQFKSLLDGDDGRLVRTGFLWEDVDENYPAGTQDESLDVNALIAGLVAEVKQLRQEVNELKGNHGDS